MQNRAERRAAREEAIQQLLTTGTPIPQELRPGGRCLRCRRKLTDPVSMAAGLGPTCLLREARIRGMDDDAVHKVFTP
jgi:hypothetical protein